MSSKLLGSPPEPFDGAEATARQFLSHLNNYYSLNEDLYNTDTKKIADAYTHFKNNTRAGEWARVHMNDALMNKAYGTWKAFVDAFETMFTNPDQKQLAINKFFQYPQGIRRFREWYQDWDVARTEAAITDDTVTIPVLRHNLNNQLEQKYSAVANKPKTLAEVVKIIQELDDSYWTNRLRSTFRGGRGRSNICSLEEGEISQVNATTAFPPLTTEERKRRRDNNLCMYCGGGGHWSDKCLKKPSGPSSSTSFNFNRRGRGNFRGSFRGRGCGGSFTPSSNSRNLIANDPSSSSTTDTSIQAINSWYAQATPEAKQAVSDIISPSTTSEKKDF